MTEMKKNSQAVVADFALSPREQLAVLRERVDSLWQGYERGMSHHCRAKLDEIREVLDKFQETVFVKEEAEDV